MSAPVDEAQAASKRYQAASNGIKTDHPTASYDILFYTMTTYSLVYSLTEAALLKSDI
jgi:hypothetical protein